MGEFNRNLLHTHTKFLSNKNVVTRNCYFFLSFKMTGEFGLSNFGVSYQSAVVVPLFRWDQQPSDNYTEMHY